MACYNESPYTCTYDSDALEGRDYSTLASWESASDNDLSGTGITILDCYDSQNHDDSINAAGSANTDVTHYRMIRSASGCTTPFAGKDATGANFVYTGALQEMFEIVETWFRVVQVCVRYNGSYSGNANAIGLMVDNAIVVNCVGFNCASSAGACYPFYAKENQNLFYNCIAYGGDGNGFQLRGSTSETIAAVCCTSIGNAGYGFEYYSSLKPNHVWSCYAADNTSGDFHEAAAYWDADSGWNAAKDASADLAAQAGDDYKNSIDYTGSLDTDHLATANISANGDAGDRCGRNPFNDFSAVVSDFNDFLRNDTAGDALFKYDIAGNERPNESSADAVWDVGASQYVAAGGAEEQAVSGAMPAASGALTKKIGVSMAGSMPAPAGALARGISFNLAGDMPAAQGAVLKKISAALLAGAMPAASASLASQIVIQQAVTGAMPASSGAISKKVGFNVAGILPVITGAISKAISFGVSGTMGAITGALTKALSIVGLAGDMPEPSGDLQSGWNTSKDDLAGEMPAASGALSSEKNPSVGAKLLKIIGMSLKKLIGG